MSKERAQELLENPYTATTQIVEAAKFIAGQVRETNKPVRFGAAAYLEVVFGHVSTAKELDLDTASNEELLASAYKHQEELERASRFLEALDDALTFDDVADICRCVLAEDGVGEDGDTWYYVFARPDDEQCFTITI